MKNKIKKTAVTALILLTLVFVNACKQNTENNQNQKPETMQTIPATKHKVTFIELGSVRCIPCQKMQPIIKSIEKKYGDQVEVVFYDVWTPEGKEKAKNYEFNLIPTQLFLDSDGKEYYRHVGYFPKEEIIKILQQKGIQ
ncbi:TlpA family protein disulfide reductase [Yeosuana marina]|uniref:TlpA family protein disulfide reductase n=1 Tax=Yeosuana marina TaxID=1565536 RepID=UPI0014214BDA|nr:thioredoxin family protein [Yeosuana marina]